MYSQGYVILITYVALKIKTFIVTLRYCVENPKQPRTVKPGGYDHVKSFASPVIALLSPYVNLTECSGVRMLRFTFAHQVHA